MCIPTFLSDTLKMPLNIRMLTSTSEIELGSNFFRGVWGGDEDVVPVDIAIASGHAGGYFSGAFDESGSLVAASYGFVGRHRGSVSLHSHVTASILAGAGFALKQHQRSWAAENGFAIITWTFDPLVRRNSVFNLEKLGAVATEYLVNFYGVMNDSLNAGDDSDRLLAEWPVDTLAGQAGGAHYASAQNAQERGGTLEFDVAVSVDSEGNGRLAPNAAALIAGRELFAVYLPADIETLRQTDIAAAQNWRSIVRQVLNECFANGAFVRLMIDNRAALLVEWPAEGAK